MIDRTSVLTIVAVLMLMIFAASISIAMYFFKKQKKNNTVKAGTSAMDAEVASWEDQSVADSSVLADVLHKLCSTTQNMLSAQGVELQLIDPKTGGITSSYVVGNPIKIDNSNVISRDLLFAGERWGTLRAQLLDATDQIHAIQTLKNLARDGVNLLLNARYSESLLAIRTRSDLQLQVTSGFLGNLSHEIRGPLGIILNASELVLEGLCGELNQDQKETLSMVKLNSEHLMELITDVLDYAKLESGKMNPAPVAVKVGEQLLELTKMVRTQADAKEQSLRCRDVPDSFIIQCDRRHLRQMILNLLTNAVKYTPDKGTIEVWGEEISESLVRICVRDSGVGIAEKDRAKVFAPFERLDDAYSQAQSGTGLGLSLTKRLVEVNGGEIGFTSEEGVGSTFWVQFPALNPSLFKNETVLPTIQSVKSEGEEILIVGPSDEERILVSRYLRGLGYEVHLVDHESEAREILNRQNVALTIIGQSYVPKEGKKLGDFVRDSQGTRYVPILFLTRDAFLVDVERFLLEDVDRCLAKPVRLEDMALACRELIVGTR